MKRLAKALSKLLPAKLEHGGRANIGDIGELQSDLRHSSEAGQVAGSNAQHFPLFEQANLGKRASVVPRLEGRQQPTVHLTPQPLLQAWMFQSFGSQCVEPIRMREENFAH